MYKQDILQKIIEYFFTAIRKLIKLDIEVTENNFEQQCNNLFLKTFGVNLDEINKIDKTKFSTIIYNEENKNDMVFLLLKIAKNYKSSNPKLSLAYFNLSKELWERSSKLYYFEDEDSKKEILKLFKDLE
jgi:hypothetical protein